jgi:hypothetical protein
MKAIIRKDIRSEKVMDGKIGKVEITTITTFFFGIPIFKSILRRIY